MKITVAAPTAKALNRRCLLILQMLGNMLYIDLQLYVWTSLPYPAWTTLKNINATDGILDATKQRDGCVGANSGSDPVGPDTQTYSEDCLNLRMACFIKPLPTLKYFAVILGLILLQLKHRCSPMQDPVLKLVLNIVSAVLVHISLQHHQKHWSHWNHWSQLWQPRQVLFWQLVWVVRRRRHWSRHWSHWNRRMCHSLVRRRRKCHTYLKRRYLITFSFIFVFLHFSISISISISISTLSW